jgi:hypothetical protein
MIIRKDYTDPSVRDLTTGSTPYLRGIGHLTGSDVLSSLSAHFEDSHMQSLSSVVSIATEIQNAM